MLSLRLNNLCRSQLVKRPRQVGNSSQVLTSTHLGHQFLNVAETLVLLVLVHAQLRQEPPQRLCREGGGGGGAG